VTDGNLLKGVRFFGEGVRTSSMILRWTTGKCASSIRYTWRSGGYQGAVQLKLISMLSQAQCCWSQRWPGRCGHQRQLNGVNSVVAAFPPHDGDVPGITAQSRSRRALRRSPSHHPAEAKIRVVFGVQFVAPRQVSRMNHLACSRYWCRLRESSAERKSRNGSV